MNKTSNGLAISSLVMGIIAVLFTNTIILAILFGALAIIFAILSKGANKTLTSKARAGILTGSGALLIGLAMFSYFVVGFMTDSTIRNKIDSEYQRQFGITYSEYIDLFTDAMVTGNQESLDKLSEVIYR